MRALITEPVARLIYVTDQSLKEMEERSKKAVGRDSNAIKSRSDTADMVPEPKSVTYIDYDDPFSLAHSSSGAPHVLTMSPYAWVGCGGDVYILDCLGKGWIRIEPVYDERRMYIVSSKAATMNPDHLVYRT